MVASRVRSENMLSLLMSLTLSNTVTLTWTWYSTPSWETVKLPELADEEKF